MMERVIRLRLRAACILRNQAVHQIEDDFLCDEWVSINFRKTFRAKPRALRKTTPVVDVRNRHVVNATGDSIRFADTHHRDVDNFGNFGRKNLRKVTHIAGVLSVGENGHFRYVTDIIEIAPNQFPD